MAYNLSKKTMDISLLTIVVLIAYNFVGNISNDIYLPTLPILVQEFHTEERLIELSFSSWFIGVTLGQIPSAVIFRFFNHKKVFFFSGVLFCLATFFCAVANNVYYLIFARFIQGFSFAACNVLTLLEIQQRSKAEQHWLYSVNGALGILSPLLGPILGAWLLLHYSWHSNFYFVLLCALFFIIMFRALRLDKNGDVKQTEIPFQLVKNICNEYLNLIGNYRNLIVCCGSGLAISCIVSYLLLSPFIIIEDFHVPISEFGYYQALAIIGYILGIGLAYKFKSFNLLKLSNRSTFLMLSGGIVIIGARLFGLQNITLYIIAIMLSQIGVGSVVNALIINTMTKLKPKTVVASVMGVATSLMCAIYTSSLSLISCDKLTLLAYVFIVNALLITYVSRFTNKLADQGADVNGLKTNKELLL